MPRLPFSLAAKRCGVALALACAAGSVAYLGVSPAAASGAAATAVTRPQVVQIRNFAFAPAVLTVSAGTTVTWRNGDDDPHTIVASDHSFRSGALSTNGAYSFTFRRAGEYVYFCSLHPHMVARVVVRAS